jgi:hypothetical protein
MKGRQMWLAKWLERSEEIASTSWFIGQRRELTCVGYCEGQDEGFF